MSMIGDDELPPDPVEDADDNGDDDDLVTDSSVADNDNKSSIEEGDSSSSVPVVQEDEEKKEQLDDVSVAPEVCISLSLSLSRLTITCRIYKQNHVKH